MSTIAEAERDLTVYKANAAKLDKLEQLFNYPLFRELIIEGFCKAECAEYIKFSTTPNDNTSLTTNALEMARAAGFLEQWFDKIQTTGNTARRMIPKTEELLVQLQNEDDGE